MYSCSFFVPASAPREGPYLTVPPEEGNVVPNNAMEEDEDEVIRDREVTMEELMEGYNDDQQAPSLISQVLPMPHNLNEFEQSDSEDELQIESTDEVAVLCHITDEVANCEMCVFDTDTYNLYTHHDMCVGELSTCMSFINQDPLEPSQNNRMFVAIGHMNGEISIWDLMILNVPGPGLVLGGTDENGNVRPGSHEDSVLCLNWNRHINILASGSADGTIKLWNVIEHGCVNTIPFGLVKDEEGEEVNPNVQSLAFHPREPHLILAGSSENIVKVFDTTNPEKVLVFEAESSVECVCWNRANPACFFVGTENGNIQCFDVRRAGQPALYTQQIHEDAVSQIITNRKRPDIIATGGDDEHVRLWKLHSSGLDPKAEKHMKIGSILSLDWATERHPSLLVSGGTENVAVWDTQEVPSIKTMLGL